MGNKCCKPQSRVSPEVGPVSSSRRWRVFQALRLGKFCATVDVQPQPIKHIETPVEPKLSRTVFEMIKEDKHLFYTTSSLIAMLDDTDGSMRNQEEDKSLLEKVQAIDTKSEEQDNFKPEGSEGSSSVTAACANDIIKSQEERVKPEVNEQEVESEETGSSAVAGLHDTQKEGNAEAVPVTEENTTPFFNGNDIVNSTKADEPLKDDKRPNFKTEEHTNEDKTDPGNQTDNDSQIGNDNQTGQDNEAHNIDVYDKQVDVTDFNKTTVIHVTEIATEEKVNNDCSQSDKTILLHRPLSPKFFSVTSNLFYDEFAGKVEDEVEEEIEVVEEDDDDDKEPSVMYKIPINFIPVDRDYTKPIHGKGEVCLNENDVMAAMSRLAFLREGNDPENEEITQTDKSITGEDITLKEDNNKETLLNIKFDELESGSKDGEENVDAKKESQLEEEVNKCDENTTDNMDQRTPLYSTDGLKNTNGTLKMEDESVDQHKSDQHKDDQLVNVSKAQNTETKTREHQIEETPSKKDGKTPSPYFESIDKDNKDVTSQPSDATVLDGHKSLESDTDINHVKTKTVERKDSITSIKSTVSLITALSLDAIKSHNSKSDCIMSLCVRSPYKGEEPRKVEVRATPKQVRDGSAENHVKVLRNLHLPPRHFGPLTAKRSKPHLFIAPALAERNGAQNSNWRQRKGSPNLAQPTSVPAFHEPTAKTLNAREKLGLIKFRQLNIGLQCKEIERIKVDAEEFPGILPPKLRAKWKQKMESKKHIN